MRMGRSCNRTLLIGRFVRLDPFWNKNTDRSVCEFYFENERLRFA